MRFPALSLFAPGALALAAGFAFGGEDESASGVRIGRASPTVEAPAIDGRLDEDVWAAAEPLTDFIQAEPFEGQPATERTEVRILFDDDAVYIGAMLYDSDPDGIIATDARRDSGLTDTDSFRVVFDTYHDLQNGFVFGTTPAGLEYDGQLSNAGGRRRRRGWRSSDAARPHGLRQRLQRELGRELDGRDRGDRRGLVR